jgi:hypothetical protein
MPHELDGIIRYDTAGPFYTPRLLYRLGFHYVEELELIEGRDRGTNHLPGSAQDAVGPYGGIVGTWRINRHRLCWGPWPLGRWKPGTPKFRR